MHPSPIIPVPQGGNIYFTVHSSSVYLVSFTRLCVWSQRSRSPPHPPWQVHIHEHSSSPYLQPPPSAAIVNSLPSTGPFIFPDGTFQGCTLMYRAFTNPNLAHGASSFSPNGAVVLVPSPGKVGVRGGVGWDEGGVSFLPSPPSAFYSFVHPDQPVCNCVHTGFIENR